VSLEEAKAQTGPQLQADNINQHNTGEIPVAVAGV
jgi:hypothetical protein